jgi:hypothetical protein
MNIFEIFQKAIRPDDSAANKEMAELKKKLIAEGNDPDKWILHRLKSLDALELLNFNMKHRGGAS